MARISDSASYSNLLNRHTLYNSAPSLSSAQVQLDGISNNLTHEASDVGNLLAMTTGAFAFRYARLGLQSFGMARSVAGVAALGGEVTVFRGASNFTSRLRGQSPQENVFDAKGWVTTFINFASLKGAGALAQNSNVVFAHALQSSAMVGSHHLAYGLNFTTTPEGNLASQFAHAEATNIALGAGQSLFNFATGGRVSRAERSLDLMDQRFRAKYTFLVGIGDNINEVRLGERFECRPAEFHRQIDEDIDKSLRE